VERISIAVDGADDAADLEALGQWLAAEPQLRGLIKTVPATPRPDELGTAADALVMAVGAGGAVSVLAASLKTFFAQPRGAKVRLVVTRADGSRIELDADRLRQSSVAGLAEQVLGAVELSAQVPGAGHELGPSAADSGSAPTSTDGP